QTGDGIAIEDAADLGIGAREQGARVRTDIRAEVTSGRAVVPVAKQRRTEDDAAKALVDAGFDDEPRLKGANERIPAEAAAIAGLAVGDRPRRRRLAVENSSDVGAQSAVVVQF